LVNFEPLKVLFYSRRSNFMLFIGIEVYRHCDFALGIYTLSKKLGSKNIRKKVLGRHHLPKT
jgi:hypothetical protein